MISINIKKRIFTSLGLFFLIYLIISFKFFLVFALIVTGILSILEFSIVIQKISKSKINLLIINILFILYIFLFCSLYFIFSNFLQLKILLYITLFGCIASDLGGFIFGKLFKGPKLSKISPNKTFSGALGSFILTYLILFSLIYYFTNKVSYEIFLIGFSISFACQLGDLFFSFIKRKAKIKDTGNMLPGHGGILDRLDGILLGLPIGLITIIIIY